MLYEEGETIELKSILTDGVKKEIIAFLNTEGGTIYVGVNDDGTLNPVLDRKEQDINLTTVSNWINDKAIYPDCKGLLSFGYDSKGVLVIKVKQGNKRPYYLRNKGMTSSGCFKRIGRSTYPMGEEEIRLMGLESDNILYEAQVSPRQDLTFVRFMDRIYSEKIEWTEDKLNTYGFKNDEGKYTNLALLFSDQNPIVVKLAVYKGLDRMEFKVKKEFSGSLALIIDLLTDYCQVCNDMRIVKPENGNFKRTEILSYPEKALREAALNAIEHANYFFLSNIKVEFFDNRVEISNPGDFYGGLTLNQALHGKQSFRNPKLVYTLDKLHFVENYATGVETIFKLYEDFDKKPVFDISNTHTTVTLPNRNYEYFLEAENEETLLSKEEGGVGTLDSQDAKTDANPRNEEGAPEYTDSLKQLLVNLIKSDGSLTQSEMAKRLNVSARTIRRLINETTETVPVGSKQKGYWKVISEKGGQKQ